MSNVVQFLRAMRPRRHLPTLTPTTRLGRWVEWIKAWF